jgi:simple sugar transport system ATP-binding protein
MGLVPNLGLSDNLILRQYRERPFSRLSLIDARAIGRFTAEKVEEYSIAGVQREAPVKSLSGGNLQKIILARELSCNPRFLVAVHPSRGLDVGAVRSVHQKLYEEKEKGTAILMISEDLDELFLVADTIAVMYEGHVMGVVPRHSATKEEIGLMMSGVHREAGI